MISVLPQSRPELEEIDINPFWAYLVCHKDHPLSSAKAATAHDLEKYPFITVRGSDERLQLSTSHLEVNCQFKLSDFYTKKLSLMQGIGFGWMPEYLIKEELESEVLRKVNWNHPSDHLFKPRLFFRRQSPGGKALGIFIDAIKKSVGKLS